MSESTLTLDYDSISRSIGVLLGWGRTPANWSAAKQGDRDQFIRRGLMQFYQAYPWSFLRPVSLLTVFAGVTGTVSGQGVYSSPNTTITATTSVFLPAMVGKSFAFDTSGTSYTIVSYTSGTKVVVSGDASSETSGDTFTITPDDGNFRLPDEFGTLDGFISFTDAQSNYGRIDIVNERQVTLARAATTTAARPRIGAIAPEAFDPTVGQRWLLMLDPRPDQQYTLSYRGQVNPDLTTAVNKYGLGGMPHALTLEESILAMAELTIREDAGGPHMMKYAELLPGSIAHDRRQAGADTVGLNLDPSVCRDGGYRVLPYRHGNVSYNGTVYGPN